MQVAQRLTTNNCYIGRRTPNLKYWIVFTAKYFPSTHHTRVSRFLPTFYDVVDHIPPLQLIQAIPSLHIFLVKIYVVCAYPFAFMFFICPSYYPSLLPSYFLLFSLYLWGIADGM